MSVRPILYYALFSPPSRAALLTSKIIGVDVELKHLNFAKKEHHADWFLKLNPNHTIPVLVDQGATICDSHAIITYIANQYGQNQHEHLYPKDFIQRALVDERLYYNNGVLSTALKDFIARIMYRDEVAYNRKSIELAHKAYSMLEGFLTRNIYVAGEHLSLADIAINPPLISLHKVVPVEKERYPKISEWMELMQRDLPEYEEINEKGAHQIYRILQTALENNMTRRT